MTLLLTLIPMNHRTHWDLSKHYPCTFVPLRFLLFLFFAQSLNRSHLFSSSPFSQTSFKKNRATEKLSLMLECIALHKISVGASRVNFTAGFSGGKLSKGRLPYQWSENPLESICWRSLLAKQKFFLTLAVWSLFFHLMQNLFHCPQIWTVPT